MSTPSSLQNTTTVATPELAELRATDGELRSLIGNLSAETQRAIADEVDKATLRTNGDATLNDGGLIRLAQLPPELLLSREFALDVLTQLRRGAIDREEAGEIFQLVSAMEATERLPNLVVAVVPCDVTDPDGLFMRQFGHKLGDDSLATFKESLQELPEERRVLITFTPHFSMNADESEEQDRSALNFIGSGLQWVGESWVTFGSGEVSSVTLMPLSVQNRYSHARFGEDSLTVVPEFGVSEPEAMVSGLIKGEQGVLVGNPFEPDETVHGYISGSFALHIHDYYHHVNRCLIPTETRTDLLALSEQLGHAMDAEAVASTLSREEDVPPLDSAKGIELTAHVVGLVRGAILDMEGLHYSQNLSDMLTQVVKTVEFNLDNNPVVASYCGADKPIPDFRNFAQMQELCATDEYRHARPIARAQALVEETIAAYQRTQIQSPFSR